MRDSVFVKRRGSRLAGSWLAVATAVLVAVPAAGVAHTLEAKPLRDRPDRVTCSGYAFKPSRVHSRKGVERDDNGPARALAKFLDGDDGSDMPRHGWRLLVRRKGVAEYGHTSHRGHGDLDWVEIDFEYGRWGLGSFGGCVPERVVKHREVPPWWLYLRRHEHLHADDRLLHLRIETGTCSPGSDADPADRLKRVEVKYTRHRVGLLVLMRPETPLPDGYACGGVGLEFPAKVKLPRRLGHRTLVDLRTVPSTVIYSELR